MRSKPCGLLVVLVLASCSSSQPSPNANGRGGTGGTGGTGASEAATTGGVGGSGGRDQSGGVSTSGSGTSTGGQGRICPMEDPTPDGQCDDADGDAIACGLLWFGATLVHGTDSVYLHFGSEGTVLRLTPEGPGDQLDTAGARVAGLAVAEPYVYWSSDRGFGRTKTQGSEPAELLTDACWPQSAFPFSDGAALYFPNWNDPARGILSVDLSDTETGRLWLHSATSGRVLAVEGDDIYVQSQRGITTLDATERCSCTCANGSQGTGGSSQAGVGGGSGGTSQGGALLTCGTRPAPGSGGSPDIDAACIGHHAYGRYSAEQEITAAAVDATHLYVAEGAKLSRVVKSGPNRAQPQAELEVPSVILPRPDAEYATIDALELDETHVYLERYVVTTGQGKRELVRVAKDGSEVVTLYQLPNDGSVVSMAMDATDIYLVAGVDGGCRFVVRRYPKRPPLP